MAFTYEIAPSGHHVKIVGTGKITTPDCIEIIKRVVSDPLHTSDSTVLVDLREATYEFEDWEELIRIAKKLEKFSYSIRNNIAIVAKLSILFPAEVLSLYIRTRMNVAIRVFLDIDAADAFCGEAYQLT